MVVRNVSRKPIKASLSVIGISMAVAVMILGSFSLDAVNYMMDFQFREAEKRQDLTVAFMKLRRRLRSFMKWTICLASKTAKRCGP